MTEPADDGTLPGLAAPQTGDPTVDAAVRDFAGAGDDLDAQVAAADRLDRTLRERLSDLDPN